MSSVTKQLEDLSFGVVRGASTDSLLPRAKALFDALDAEGLLSVFKVLPRSLTYPSIDKFFAAESQLSSSAVSTSLLSTQFAGCAPTNNDKYFTTVGTALSRAANDASLAASSYEWRIAVCARRPIVAALNAETHAVAAMTYALTTPQCVDLEPLADAVKDLPFATAEGKALSALIASTLDGQGIAALSKALPALQKLEIAEAASRKIKLLDLAAFCHGKRSSSGVVVTYAELKDRLQAKDDDEVENLVIDATIVGIIDAKVNKSDKRVAVHAAVPLRFDKAAWEGIRAQTVALSSSVSQLLENFAAAGARASA